MGFGSVTVMAKAFSFGGSFGFRLWLFFGSNIEPDSRAIHVCFSGMRGLNKEHLQE